MLDSSLSDICREPVTDLHEGKAPGNFSCWCEGWIELSR